MDAGTQSLVLTTGTAVVGTGVFVYLNSRRLSTRKGTCSLADHHRAQRERRMRVVEQQRQARSSGV